MKGKQIASFFVLAMALLCLFNAGCTRSTQGNSDIFSQGLLFQNDEFGITMKIPDNWLHTKEDTDAFIELGKSQGLGQSGKDRRKLFALVNKYPMKSGVNDNVAVTWTIQDVSMYPGLESLDVALNAKEIAEKKLDAITKEPYYTKIDGIDFCVLESTFTHRKAFQKNYLAVLNGYVYNFAFTYSTPEDLNTCNEILKSIKIRKGSSLNQKKQAEVTG